MSFTFADAELGSALASHRAAWQRVLLWPVRDRVRLGAALGGLERASDQVHARLCDTELSGDLLGGADGIRLVVGQIVFGDTLPRVAGYSVALCTGGTLKARATCRDVEA